MDAIRKQLIEADPRSETRNKFALDPPPNCADYDLRAGKGRALYRVEEEEEVIRLIVAIIGRKDRDKLIVEGEIFEL